MADRHKRVTRTRIQSRIRVRRTVSPSCSSTSWLVSSRANLRSEPAGRCGSRRPSSPLAALYALWTYRQVAALRDATASSCSACASGCSRSSLFALLRPMLLLKVAVPAAELRRHPARRLAQHAGGRPQRQAAQRVHRSSELGRPDAPLLTALGKRFNLRIFRFSSSAERLQSHGGPDVRGHRHAPRRRARSRAQRAERPAGGRLGRRDRRRRTTPSGRSTSRSPG